MCGIDCTNSSRACMKYSFIIPIYNGEKYLRECLASVLSQTVQDFEVLLVDDGSTDGSGKMCDEYEKKYARIRVFLSLIHI